MKRRTKLISGVIAVYLFFLILYVPADLAFGFLLKGVSTPMGLLRCNTLHGTWRQGAGFGGQLGDLYLEDFQWRFRPWAMLTGRLSAAVTAKLGQGRVDATINRGFGAISVSGLDGDIDLSGLAPLMYRYGVQLRGSLVAAMEEFSVHNGRVDKIDGKLIWKDAEIVSPIKSDFGAFEIDFVTSDEGVKGTFVDAGAPIKIEGGGLLQRDGSYTLSVTLQARTPEAQKQIDGLAFLGKKRGDGGVQLSLTGKLPTVPL